MSVPVRMGERAGEKWAILKRKVLGHPFSAERGVNDLFSRKPIATPPCPERSVS